MTLWHDRPESWHEVLPGARRRILSHGHGVMMVLYEIGPNTTIPRHSHPHVQSGLFLSGGGRFQVGTDTYRMVPGSAYSIPGGVPHELVTDASGPSRVLDVFVPERADFLSEAVPSDPPDTRGPA